MPDDLNISTRIAASCVVANGIRLFELRALNSAELPEFTAGSHLSVRVPNGLIRKYSLCNDPGERDRYVIAVLREPNGRGGSASFVDEAKIGDVTEISLPRNDFPLVTSLEGYTFIAGGIGITPIMSMIRVLNGAGSHKFSLYYCTRSQEITAFHKELMSAKFDGRVIIHHDGGNPENALDLWPILENPKGHLYCCGPRGLMEAVRNMAGHWSASAVHFEAFTEAEPHKKSDKEFQVVLARSGTLVTVAADKTILESIRAAGYEAPSSCESGTCGTCKTRLLEGEVDHRDLVLLERERESNVMICVSRAKSNKLIIDR
jgi:phthalate 4,5-dioxygenase reductase subunit